MYFLQLLFDSCFLTFWKLHSAVLTVIWSVTGFVMTYTLILSLMISIHMINIQNGMSKSLASYLATSVEIPKRLDSGFILVCSFFGELTTGGLWTSTEGKRAPILPGDDPGLKYPGEPTDDLPLKYILRKISIISFLPRFLPAACGKVIQWV